MKLVQYAIAAAAAVVMAACGADGSSGTQAKCEADSTFAQVQQQIFDGYGCTASACHGEAIQGGLDLRPPNAYANLVNVPASSSDSVRVFPGAQDLSVLYQKVASKTQGFQLATLESPISGSPMPSSNDVLTEDDLSLLRVWIRGGAPETGVVAGSQQYASCELQGNVAPNKIQPLPAPAADEGVQFYSGAWEVPAEQEGEVCFVSYYDYSDSIPQDFVIPCGDEQGGPDRDCFAYDRSLLAQDPQSHHSIIEFYVPPDDKQEQWDPMDPSWKDAWSCLGGDKDGVACTPGGSECGERSQCTTRPLTTVGCIGYQNAPPELGTVFGFFGRASVRQNLVTAQEATFRESYPPNVYAIAPVKGFIVWDSHAFNLTTTDTTIEQWLNLTFAPPDQLLYERRQIFDADDIFGMGRIEAFQSTEACASFEMPKSGRLLTLSSHTHRHGTNFRVWYPPNEVCDNDVAGMECKRPDRDPDYVSFDYADPLYQRFADDAIPSFGPDSEDRTFVYCAVWDNGETNPEEVRRNSQKPEAETCDFVEAFSALVPESFRFFTCGCAAAERSCFGGPNEGTPCNGDDSVCGEGGMCDACPLGGGVTTEEEMFILLGSYYVETP